MNPITLPTSPETRAALEKAGWVVALHALYEIWDCNLVQVVLTTGDCRVTDLFQHLSEPGAMMRLLEFATTRGICIPGYRIIPEETATAYLAARDTFFGPKERDDPETTMKNWTGLEDAEENLAVALGGTRLLPARPSGDGGLSPSTLAALDDEAITMMSEVIDREPGFHQVNPINQRKAAAAPQEED